MAARILIVEDDASLGENLSEILHLFGYVPIAVTNAEAALDLIGNSPVDLILTDVRLPSMNGIDLLECVRAKGCAIPALLMTDWTTNETLEGGPSQLECLAKPLTIAGLLGAISRLVGGSEAHLPAAAARSNEPRHGR